MSSYHSSFKYLGKKSDRDFGWIISHFDPDNGETESYLSQDQVYTDSYKGTKRTLYGTKYNSVATPKITVIKQDGSDFTLGECRDAYRWLTGNPEASWMDLYIGDEVKYRLLCTIQDVKPQKLDARTIGLNIYCESLSPWAYSPLQTIKSEINASGTKIQIENETDDLYTPIYLKTTYTNSSGTSLSIINETTGERPTEISKLVANETITLDGNMFIASDKPGKVFGNAFNFIWPYLTAGTNVLNVIGNGDITFEYYYSIKMGDCAQNINIVRDPICDDWGNIQVDTLPFDRISNLPTTLKEHNIQDAYTKSEVDSMLKNFTQADVYTKEEIDEKFENIDIPSIDTYTKSEIDEKLANIDISGIDTYTKTEIDEKLKNITSSGVDINEQELDAMLAEVLQ